LHHQDAEVNTGDIRHGGVEIAEGRSYGADYDNIIFAIHRIFSPFCCYMPMNVQIVTAS